MKFYVQTLFLLFVVTSLYGEAAPHLILNIDINQTIIATDKAGNKSIEDSLNEMLGKKYKARWDASLQEEMTFYDYLNKVLIPGPAYDPELYRQRKQYLHHFVDYLQEQNSPIYPLAFADYTLALEVLQKSQGSVFPSFYSLLKYLNEQQISYSIILRSFGWEVREVKDEINTSHPGLINQTAEFRKGKLYLENGEIIEGACEIYKTLRTIGHIAIHDDWSDWNAHALAAKQGKPFYIDEENADTISIFFDDHINETNAIKNIISPRSARSGEIIPIKKLVDLRLAVRVNTVEAIVNENYFIEHVQKATEKNKQ